MVIVKVVLSKVDCLLEGSPLRLRVAVDASLCKFRQGRKFIFIGPWPCVRGYEIDRVERYAVNNEEIGIFWKINPGLGIACRSVISQALLGQKNGSNVSYFGFWFV